MELSALIIGGARPLRADSDADGIGGAADLRAAWMSRLPSVEPGSMSEAYRSFRAHEGNPMPPMSSPPPLVGPPATGQSAILSGTLPAALAAYGEASEE